MGISDINFFGEIFFRNERKKFGIKTDDRRRHMYVIGKTGMGKTELLHNMAIQDIRAGRGIGFIDPHGEAAENILNFIPKERIDDVCYFNPADLDFPISFNVIEKVSLEYRHLVASGLMEVFKKIWPDLWSARMEYILHNTLLALLEMPESTLLEVNRILADPDYRKKITKDLKDPIVKAFWQTEFAKYPPAYAAEATAAIQNKIGQFISAPLIRNIIGQVHSSVDIRKIMDGEKILILNLSKGKIGEDSAKLLGGLIITKLQLAAMSRVDIPEKERKDFFLYVDEFQNFATASFCNILSEARKYRLSLILAHQYITQMAEEVKEAVFGNVGTIISFRIGAEDAEYIEKEFTPFFNVQDFVNLPKYQIYLKLMVDGIAGKPFSAETLAPLERPAETFKDEIIRISREKYSFPREQIEKQIAQWAGNFVLKEKTEEKTEEKTTTAVQLYDAICDQCGKWSKVPIKPEPGRKVYCKSCRQKLQTKQAEEIKQREEKLENQIKELTLEELLLKKATPFKSKREIKTEEKKETPVNEEELKRVLGEALAEKEEEKPEQQESEQENLRQEEKQKDKPKPIIKQGEIKPGQIVEF